MNNVLKDIEVIVNLSALESIQNNLTQSTLHPIDVQRFPLAAFPDFI